MAFTLRSARADDQAVITALVRRARINPRGLQWQNFLLAEDGGSIIGVGQVKPHADGVRELASIAVIPQRQHQGIASMIIRALLAKETGPIYLMCIDNLATFYMQFGFHVMAPTDLPRSLAKEYRLGSRILRIFGLVVRQRLRLMVMVREVR
ncbi:MAG: GNAT family N-acetyltransferase [Herpetosiphonaceae bacterium]|nr:GNAT family N-acetyltransferase [Herpetosiphonaceae bacterium]